MATTAIRKQSDQQLLPLPVALLLAYAMVVGATIWGWLHWHADFGAGAPPLAMVAWISPLLAILWTLSVLAAARIDTTGRIKRAVIVALQMHIPFTFIALMTPITGIWIGLMALAAGWALIAAARELPNLSLIGAPYVAWLGVATLMSVLRPHQFAPQF
jgi:hypothetical protein